MRVGWIVSAAPEQAPSGWTSTLASLRYRVLTPLAFLEPLGVTSTLHVTGPVPVPVQDEPRPRVREWAAKLDVVVISKSFWSGNSKLLTELLDREIPVVCDFCDDHFGRTPLGDHYQDLAQRASAIVCSTQVLAERIAKYTSRPTAVIGDPFEGPMGVPRWDPSPRLRLLWFGHPSNLLGLVQALPQITSGPPADLLVLSTTAPSISDALSAWNVRHGDALRVELHDWSTDRTWAALRDCDAVLLPTSTTPLAQAKSANRLVEALVAGRLAVAHPMPAYQALERYCLIGDDLGASLSWARAHPHQVLERLREGQRHVSAEFHPTRIAAQWALVLRHLGPA